MEWVVDGPRPSYLEEGGGPDSVDRGRNLRSRFVERGGGVGVLHKKMRVSVDSRRRVWENGRGLNRRKNVMTIIPIVFLLLFYDRSYKGVSILPVQFYRGVTLWLRVQVLPGSSRGSPSKREKEVGLDFFTREERV